MIEVLKQMVEALEWCHGGEPVGTADAIQAGKQLIAELESQESVAWKVTPRYEDSDGYFDFTDSNETAKELERRGWSITPLYTHPPQRTEQEPVQVSPLEFVEMVMEKEDLIGKPIFWAKWPNKEKNT